jgi:hypothetical protein
MSVTKIVRYTTRPECADENERLIRQVFAELNAKDPGQIAYAAFRLADGVSFMHVAVLDGDRNPLHDSAAFAEFQANIAERCVTGPAGTDAGIVGSYRMPAG